MSNISLAVMENWNEMLNSAETVSNVQRESTGSGEGEREGGGRVRRSLQSILLQTCEVRWGGEGGTVNPTKITWKSQVDVPMVCPSL